METNEKMFESKKKDWNPKEMSKHQMLIDFDSKSIQPEWIYMKEMGVQVTDIHETLASGK